MRPNPVANQAVSEVVDRLFRIASDLHHQLGAAAAGYGLTGQQAMLVRSLDDPIPMRVLAEELSCDPSTVTGLVDRIERLGLIERLPDEADRRIRLLTTLTREGERVRDEIKPNPLGGPGRYALGSRPDRPRSPAAALERD